MYLKQFLLSLILLILFFAYSFAESHLFTISGKVVKVTDGDTITILNNKNEQINVRLYGIDAPESKQAYGEVSRKFLANMIAAKEIDVLIYDIDRYKRIVGRVLINGLDVNKEMVANGYAWVYLDYNKLPNKQEWIKLENKAKIEKKGLWNDEKAVAPWQWRNNKEVHQENPLIELIKQLALAFSKL